MSTQSKHGVQIADDSDACRKLECLSKWWNKLTEIGPLFGYFPNAKKTVLISERQR
jgi:hypothetical protein